MASVAGGDASNASRTAAASPAACASTSARRSVQSAVTRPASSTTPMRPPRLSFGRYVPAQNGSRSGVSSTVSGHPPCPVIAWHTAMYTASTSGRSSRSTLMQTNALFSAAAASSSSKLSRSITWHQWHVA